MFYLRVLFYIILLIYIYSYSNINIYFYIHICTYNFDNLKKKGKNDDNSTNHGPAEVNLTSRRKFCIIRKLLGQAESQKARNRAWNSRRLGGEKYFFPFPLLLSACRELSSSSTTVPEAPLPPTAPSAAGDQS
jgi:predicted glycosyltransferase involved in capsule biosynthesis